MKHLRNALASAMALLCASAHAQTSQSGLTTDTLANWIASNGVAAYQAEQDAQAAKTAAAAALQPGNNLSDVVSAAIARTNLGLGAMALQAASNVAITGGAINGTAIGGTTPAAGAFTTLQASTPVPVTSGGTGGSSAASARSGLGAAASGSNSDITSLSGLSTPLSVGQGGTGATSASGARTALGAAASGANTDITSLASPALGAATATTQAASDSSTKVATTAQVQAAIANAGGGAPTAANPQSSNYTATAADRGKTLVLSGSATLTLGSGTAAPGWYAWVKKTDGSGVWAITPASGTIEGLPAINIYQESYLVWYDAANSVYRTQDRPKGWISIGTTTVSSAVASVGFTTGFSDTELRHMRITAEGISPSAADYPVFTVARGGSYLTSGYSFNAQTVGGGSQGAGNFNTGAALANTTGTNWGATFTVGRFSVTSPSGPRLSLDGSASGGVNFFGSGQGYNLSNSNAVTGVSFAFGGGANVVAGQFTQEAFRP